MKITSSEIQYVAKLAKLQFDDGQIEDFTRSFEQIMDHFHNLSEVTLQETGGRGVSDLLPVTREDVCKPYGDQERLFAGTKAMKDGYVEVPKVVD